MHLPLFLVDWCPLGGEMAVTAVVLLLLAVCCSAKGKCNLYTAWEDIQDQ